MGKPAARVGDLTAHGGMIAGPGCLTVLIGGKPAARLTDTHVCPMFNGPAPHGGGPLVGPGCPTILIGNLPAVCVGDLATCAGPPATILPPGCPTVFLGSASGGGGHTDTGGARSEGSAHDDATPPPAVESVTAIETTTTALKQDRAQPPPSPAPRQTPRPAVPVGTALTQGAGGAIRDRSEQVVLTLTDIREILEAIEQEEGSEAARHFVSYLDYAKLTSMAMSGTDGNDPNRMPTRFMLLWGADDNRLTDIDPHPDCFSTHPEHLLTVHNLRAALRLLGRDIAAEGPYDHDLLCAHAWYLSRAWPRAEPPPPHGHVVESGQSLSALAELYGLVSWKYLYHLNRAVVGENPDLVAADTTLTIPTWDSTRGEELIAARGAPVFPYIGGARYAYPWVPYSVTLLDARGAVLREHHADNTCQDHFTKAKQFELIDEDSGGVLAQGTTRRADGIALLVPDAVHRRLNIDGRWYG